MRLGFYQGLEEINLSPMRDSPMWKVLNANGTVIDVMNPDIDAYESYINFTLVLER